MVPRQKNGSRPREAIVVDMGGTTTRLGVCTDGGRVEQITRFPTPDPVPGSSADFVRETHLDLIAESARRLCARYPEANEVGVAVGATITNSGLVRNASLLWHQPSTGFDLAGAIGARLPWANVTVLNDISAAAWHYRSLGRFALITVSTGVAVKLFDDALPPEKKLLLDEEGLGGEMGHTVLDPSTVFDQGTGLDPSTARARGVRIQSLGRAAACGDMDARAALERMKLPWCECGTVGDLCSYTSGPAVTRAAIARARANPQEWADSALCRLCGSRPERLTTYSLAQAARDGDAFTGQILRAATCRLALRIAQLSADLGLQTAVITGGFAHALGTPWFTALRENMMQLPAHAGWFTDWTPERLADLIHRPLSAENDSLAGMGAYLAARREQVRELRKPVNEARTAVSVHTRPRVGREQFAARIAFAGICGTDLQILRGERGGEPGVLGHECVAEVIEVGADVTGVRVGEVITLNPNHPYDEHEKIGHNQPGIFSEIAILDGHLADRGQVIPLSAEGLAEWVLLEPLACAVRAMRMITTQWADKRVLIVGAGISGLLHVLLARFWNARQVLLANRSQERLDEAISRRFCASQDTVLLGGNPALAIRQATDGNAVDAVIVAVSGGAGSAIVEDLWPCVDDGATIHLFGGFPPDSVIHTPDGSAVTAASIRGPAGRYKVQLASGGTCVLTGSRGGQREDFEMARELCAGPGNVHLQLAPLVTHIVSLDALPAALDEMARAGTVQGEFVLRAVVDLSLPGTVVRQVTPDTLPSLAGSR